MGERLKIISKVNPQPEIRRASENLDWPYREEAELMYKVGQVMMERFFNGLVYLDGKKVPDPLIAFDDLRNNNVLACYDLFPDEYGLMYKITHNTQQYEVVDGSLKPKYGRFAVCEVQLHEMIHAWQQDGRGKEPYKRGKSTHNKEFCQTAKQLGLNVVPNVGCHFAPADEGSPFAILMHEMGIQRPTDVPIVEDTRGRRFDWFEIGKKEKGRSTLSGWVCPECNMKVRLGVKGNPELIHAPCSEKKGTEVFLVRNE